MEVFFVLPARPKFGESGFARPKKPMGLFGDNLREQGGVLSVRDQSGDFPLGIMILLLAAVFFVFFFLT